MSELQAPPVPAAGGRWRNLLRGAPLAPLVILFGLNAVDELDRVAFAVLTPEIRDHFDLDFEGITTLIGVVAGLALLGQVFIGFYADRFRRVPIALTGAAVWTLFTLGTGLAPTVVVLVVMRVGSAMGKAVNDPTHNSLLSDYYEPSIRPRAFYYHRIANNVGLFIGPIVAGGLALAFGWRAPFLIFWAATAAFVVLGLAKLREPVRGAHERRLAGGDTDLVNLEEEPPSFGEAWRVAHQVRTLRRIFYSLPWLAAVITGLTALYSLYYEEVYDLNELSRGVIATAAEVPQIIGGLLGASMVMKMVNTDPGRIVRALAGAAFVIAGGILIVAVAPWLPLAVAGHMLASGAGAVITAGIYVAVSLVLPPRVRSFGFGAGALYAVPGVLIILPIVGAVGDSAGIRWGLILMVPVFLVGAFILASSGSLVDGDVRRVRAAALAQAELLDSRRKGRAKLLVCRGVDVHYGQTQVLFGVDFEVDDGEMVALLGTNGAGKSTLLNAIAGLVDPSGGAIIFEGRDITIMPANETVGLGVVTVPGGKGVFPTLTVAENLELAGWLFDKDPDHVRRATEQVLEYFPILRDRWDQKAGNLSGGEQQMLTLGQAFIAKPKLMMIDELSLGLAPVIIDQLLRIVRAIHAQGTTVILVEQSVNVAITVAERAVFLEKGEVRFDGPTADLLERPEILRAVFLKGTAAGRRAAQGTDPDHEAPARRPAGALGGIGGRAPVALETRGLSISFGGIRAVNDVDLQLHQGEILGLIGPNGAGKTTVMDLVSGFLTPSSGRVFLNGREITELTPDVRAVRGLGRSFQDARLFPALTVHENLAIALERHIATRDPIAAALASPAVKVSEREVKEKVARLVELMNLQAFANKFVSELSTGTRRVVDIACSLAHEPSVLLLDEPSSGIAQRETEALGPVLLDIREQMGAALLVIEHDMPLIQSISDRLVALELGAVIAEGTADEVVNHPRVIESYLGTSEEAIKRSGAHARSTGSRTGRAATNGGRRRRRQPLVARSDGRKR